MDEWAGCGGFRRLKRIERTGARQGCAGKVEGFEGRIGVDTGGDLAQERRAAKRGKNRPLDRAEARERSLAVGAVEGEGILRKGKFGRLREGRMCVSPSILRGEIDFSTFPRTGELEKNNKSLLTKNSGGVANDGKDTV